MQYEFNSGVFFNNKNWAMGELLSQLVSKQDVCFSSKGNFLLEPPVFDVVRETSQGSCTYYVSVYPSIYNVYHCLCTQLPFGVVPAASSDSNKVDAFSKESPPPKIPTGLSEQVAPTKNPHISFSEKLHLHLIHFAHM